MILAIIIWCVMFWGVGLLCLMLVRSTYLELHASKALNHRETSSWQHLDQWLQSPRPKDSRQKLGAIGPFLQRSPRVILSQGQQDIMVQLNQGNQQWFGKLRDVSDGGLGLSLEKSAAFDRESPIGFVLTGGGLVVPVVGSGWLCFIGPNHPTTSIQPDHPSSYRMGLSLGEIQGLPEARSRRRFTLPQNNSVELVAKSPWPGGEDLRFEVTDISSQGLGLKRVGHQALIPGLRLDVKPASWSGIRGRASIEIKHINQKQRDCLGVALISGPKFRESFAKYLTKLPQGPKRQDLIIAGFFERS